MDPALCGPEGARPCDLSLSQGPLTIPRSSRLAHIPRKLMVALPQASSVPFVPHVPASLSFSLMTMPWSLRH